MRIYHHYQQWEDFHNGLYEFWELTEERREKCFELLTNLQTLHIYMHAVVEEWKNAAEQQMTNPSRNKQAWLGQASCCMYCGANEDNVKEVWKMLSDDQQKEANNVADKIINYYNAKNLPTV